MTIWFKAVLMKQTYIQNTVLLVHGDKIYLTHFQRFISALISLILLQAVGAKMRHCEKLGVLSVSWHLEFSWKFSASVPSLSTPEFREHPPWSQQDGKLLYRKRMETVPGVGKFFARVCTLKIAITWCYLGSVISSPVTPLWLFGAPLWLLGAPLTAKNKFNWCPFTVTVSWLCDRIPGYTELSANHGNTMHKKCH